MKLKNLILILSVAIIEIGALVYLRTASCNMSENIINWKTYVNERYEFSIRYPKDWELEYIGPTSQFPNVRFSPNIAIAVTFTNPKALKNSALDRSLGKGEYKVLIMVSENKKNLSLKDWANQEINLLTEHCQKEYTHSITIHNLPAIKVKEMCQPVWGCPEAPCVINIYFIKDNNLFSVQYLGGDFNAENIFNVMIESLYWKSGIPETETFICQSNSDCIIKEGQCGPGCFHKNQEPKINSEIVCEYRPWFKQERCECINNKCTKIICEDLGLDYPECNQ